MKEGVIVVAPSTDEETRLFEIGPALIRLSMDSDDEPLLEIADPGNDSAAMQWLTIGGSENLERLGRAILQYLVAYGFKSE